jgi:hypothetical protein
MFVFAAQAADALYLMSALYAACDSLAANLPRERGFLLPRNV